MHAMLRVCALAVVCAVLVQANQWSQDSQSAWGDPHMTDHAGKSFDYQHPGISYMAKSKIDNYAVQMYCVPDPAVFFDAATKKMTYRDPNFHSVVWPVGLAVHETSGLTVQVYIMHTPNNCASKTTGQCGVTNSVYITSTMDGMRLDQIEVAKMKTATVTLKGATDDTTAATVTVGDKDGKKSFLSVLSTDAAAITVTTAGGTVVKVTGYTGGSFWNVDVQEPKDYQSCDKMSGIGASSCPGEDSKNWMVTCADNRFETPAKALKAANVNAWTPDMDSVMFPTCTPSNAKATEVSGPLDINTISYTHGLTKAQCETLCAPAKSVPLVYTSCMLDTANSGNADAAHASLAALCSLKGVDTTGLGCQAAQNAVVGDTSSTPASGTHVPSCEDVNFCAADPARLERHGACSLLQGQVHCYCYDGWKGTNCTEYKGVDAQPLMSDANSATNTALLAAILVCVLGLIVAIAGVLLYKRHHHHHHKSSSSSTSSHHHHSTHTQVEGQHNSTASYTGGRV